MCPQKTRSSPCPDFPFTMSRAMTVEKAKDFFGSTAAERGGRRRWPSRSCARSAPVSASWSMSVSVISHARSQDGLALRRRGGNAFVWRRRSAAAWWVWRTCWTSRPLVFHQRDNTRLIRTLPPPARHRQFSVIMVEHDRRLHSRGRLPHRHRPRRRQPRWQCRCCRPGPCGFQPESIGHDQISDR